MNARAFDPLDYEVRTVRVTMDGEVLFRAKVDELPDLEVYDADRATAIDETISMIADLHAAAVEQGRPFPEPIKRPDEDEYSGRITLRTTPMLHSTLAAQAQRDNVSLNHEINMQLMQTSTMKEMVAEFAAKLTPLPLPARESVNAAVKKYQGVVRAYPVKDAAILAGIVKEAATVEFMHSIFHAQGETRLTQVYPTTQRSGAGEHDFFVQELRTGLDEGEEIIERAKIKAAHATPVQRASIRTSRGKPTHG